MRPVNGWVMTGWGVFFILGGLVFAWRPPDSVWNLLGYAIAAGFVTIGLYMIFSRRWGRRAG